MSGARVLSGARVRRSPSTLILATARSRWEQNSPRERPEDGILPFVSYPEQPPPPLDNDVLGRRVAAALIDLLLMFLLFVVMAALFGSSRASGGQASANLDGGPALAYFAMVFVYFFVQEVAGGQTLGKRMLGVKVVRADGSAAGAGPIAGRTALRIVDGLFLYLVGLIVILATGKKRARVGDLAAGTQVVRA